jgi:hypothetical protein
MGVRTVPGNDRNEPTTAFEHQGFERGRGLSHVTPLPHGCSYPAYERPKAPRRTTRRKSVSERIACRHYGHEPGRFPAVSTVIPPQDRALHYSYRSLSAGVIDPPATGSAIAFRRSTSSVRLRSPRSADIFQKWDFSGLLSIALTDLSQLQAPPNHTKAIPDEMRRGF